MARKSKPAYIMHLLIERLKFLFIGSTALMLSFFFFTNFWPWYPNNAAVHAQGSLGEIESRRHGRSILFSTTTIFRLSGEDQLFRISHLGDDFEKEATNADKIELICLPVSQTWSHIAFQDNEVKTIDEPLCDVADISFDGNLSYLSRLGIFLTALLSITLFVAGCCFLFWVFTGASKDFYDHDRKKKIQPPLGSNLRSILRDHMLAEKRIQRRQAIAGKEGSSGEGAKPFLWASSQIDLPDLCDQDCAYGIGMSSEHSVFGHRHTIVLRYSSEARFGPSVFHLEINKHAVSRKREFIDDLAWTSDGKYLAIFEFVTSQQGLRSGAAITVFNLEDMTFCHASIPHSESRGALDCDDRGAICYRCKSDSGTDIYTPLDMSALGPWKKINFE